MELWKFYIVYYISIYILEYYTNYISALQAIKWLFVTNIFLL